jgi:translation initiation factor 2 subunit 2
MSDFLKSYEELLAQARKALPEKTQGAERFEPPVVESFMQGSKTEIRNFEVICQKIRRDKQLLLKYFAKEMAIPTTLDGSRLVLHGKFNERMLNEKLRNFIEAYVICKECKRPDTKIVDQSGFKTLICEACGARAPIKL